MLPKITLIYVIVIFTTLLQENHDKKVKTISLGEENYRLLAKNDHIWSSVWRQYVEVIRNRDIIYDDFPIEVCSKTCTPHKNPLR